MKLPSDLNWAELISHQLYELRKRKPLVQNITNFVTMDFAANALLSLGASPIMAHAKEELEEMIGIASSLVINIGTLDTYWINNMEKAIHYATNKKIPVVLDPVGAGASLLRTKTAMKMLESGGITSLRANASETMALDSGRSETKGVDSVHSSDETLANGRSISKRHSLCSIVSGKSDHIYWNDNHLILENGVEMMSAVTGMGCISTAIMGAFSAVETYPEIHPILSAASSMACMGIAGELAAKNSSGPGSFKMYFLDSLFQIKESEIHQFLKIKVNS